MGKYVRELASDIAIAQYAGSIVNYGERYRNGERIGTAFTESTINQAVSRQLVKGQRMQWTPTGAYLLLQVRTQAHYDDWDSTLRSLYPRFRPVQTPVVVTSEAA